MVARLQAWFARQSLTVKLLIAVPVLAGAVLWATLPDTSPRASDLGNRPVLPPLSTPGASGTPGSAGALGTPGSSSVPSNPSLAPGVNAAQATIAIHQEPAQVDSSLSWATLLRTLVSVVVVIGLILVSARGLKYFIAAQGQAAGSGANVRVVETTYVPAPSGRGRSALHLIEVGDRLLLVGATDSNLSLLAEFDEGLGGRIRLASRESSNSPAVPSTRAGSTSRSATPGVAATSAAAALSFGELLAAASDKGPTASTPAAEVDLTSGEAKPARDGELAHMLERLRASKQRLDSDL